MRKLIEAILFLIWTLIKIGVFAAGFVAIFILILLTIS